MLQTNEVFFYLLTMKIEELYPLYAQHFLVDTDTRKIRKNTLFFALKGNDLMEIPLLKKHSKLVRVIASSMKKSTQPTPSILLVDNVLETLQQLAHYHRTQLGIPIIGLTGSNGKTTTKELIKAVDLQKIQNRSYSRQFQQSYWSAPHPLIHATRYRNWDRRNGGQSSKRDRVSLRNVCPRFWIHYQFWKGTPRRFWRSCRRDQRKNRTLQRILRENDKTAFVNPQ